MKKYSKKDTIIITVDQGLITELFYAPKSIKNVLQIDYNEIMENPEAYCPSCEERVKWTDDLICPNCGFDAMELENNLK